MPIHHNTYKWQKQEQMVKQLSLFEYPLTNLLVVYIVLEEVC